MSDSRRTGSGAYENGCETIETIECNAKSQGDTFCHCCTNIGKYLEIILARRIASSVFLMIVIKIREYDTNQFLVEYMPYVPLLTKFGQVNRIIMQIS